MKPQMLLLLSLAAICGMFLVIWILPDPNE